MDGEDIHRVLALFGVREIRLQQETLTMTSVADELSRGGFTYAPEDDNYVSDEEGAEEDEFLGVGFVDRREATPQEFVQAPVRAVGYRMEWENDDWDTAVVGLVITAHGLEPQVVKQGGWGGPECDFTTGFMFARANGLTTFGAVLEAWVTRSRTMTIAHDY